MLLVPEIKTFIKRVPTHVILMEWVTWHWHSNHNGMGDYVVGICIQREKGEGKYEIDYATIYFHSYLQCMYTYTTL